MPIAVDVADESIGGCHGRGGPKAAFGRIDVLINNASLFSNLTKRPFDEITAGRMAEGHGREHHGRLPLRSAR